MYRVSSEQCGTRSHLTQRLQSCVKAELNRVDANARQALLPAAPTPIHVGQVGQHICSRPGASP